MIDMWIPSIPRGQARVRHTRCGMAYKDKAQRLDEIRLSVLMRPHKPENPMTGPIRMHLVVDFPIPPSKSKAWKLDALRGIHRPTGRPDLSNVIKHVEDILQSQGFFINDSQIVDVRASKHYSETPGYLIVLTPESPEESVVQNMTEVSR